MHKKAAAEERATKNLKPTVHHLGSTEVIYGFPRTVLCNAKEKPQRLFANSSRKRQRIATQLSQPLNAVPHLDLRGAACANKLLPRCAAKEPTIRHLGSLPVVRGGTLANAAAFGNLPIHFQNANWLCERAILTPQNDSVAHVAS